MPRYIPVTADDYTGAAKRLVEQYQEIMGAPAIGVARKNENLKLKEDDVTGFEGGRDELDALITQYEEIIGQVAVRMARKALADVDVALPERVEA
ncbi:MAG: hypothetical protein SV186_00160 [Candidatus Nanohaloarchaea archaeon]|nr:hypothetical protein [Candidatus Nanohaloarchaea archaeon]